MRNKRKNWALFTQFFKVIDKKYNFTVQLNYIFEVFAYSEPQPYSVICSHVDVILKYFGWNTELINALLLLKNVGFIEKPTVLPWTSNCRLPSSLHNNGP